MWFCRLNFEAQNHLSILIGLYDRIKKAHPAVFIFSRSPALVPIIISIVVVCFLLLLFSRPRRRDGLVPNGGSRLKNAAAIAMVKSGAKAKDKPEWQSSAPAEARVPVPEGIEVKDYNDSFVFQGADGAGNVLLTRLGFRDAGEIAEVWFWGAFGGRRFANGERFVTGRADADQSLISSSGLTYERMEDGVWRISYEGLLEGRPSKVDLTWTADGPLYCSADCMDARGMGLAMAEMPWSREYFERIRSEKQVRIEQGGRLTGAVDIDGETIGIDMRGVRDHSWGKRNWNFINRYIWTVLALDEEVPIAGVKARYAAIHAVDYGDSFKRLASGWIAGEGGVLPVNGVVDPMDVGNDGIIPAKFNLDFSVTESGRCVLEVDRRQPEMPWLMNNNRFEVNEAYCSVVLNGVKGNGLAEFGYSAGLGYHRPFETEKEE